MILGPLGFYLSGGVTRLTTPNGEIVIRSDAAEVEVTIKRVGDKQVAVVVDREAKREYLLQPGEYEIDVTLKDAGGEARFLTKRLALTRGGKEIVEARLELAKKKEPAAVAGDKIDPARAIAALEKLGATLRYGPEAAGKPVIEVIAGGIIITDDDLRMVQAFPSLKILMGSPPPSSKKRLAITDRGLEHLKGLTELWVLSFHGTEIGDGGLKHLEGLKSLEEVGLGGSNVGDAGLVSLKALPKLSQVLLTRTKVTDAGMATLAEIGTLQHLYIDGTAVGDAGLKNLKPLKGLLTLVPGGNITEKGLLDALIAFPELQTLRLDYSKQITDAVLPGLRGLGKLRTLTLSSTAVTDAGLTDLGEMKGLQELNLGETAITDAGLGHLKSLSQLQNLNLVNTAVTDAGVAELRKALPKLKVLR